MPCAPGAFFGAGTGRILNRHDHGRGNLLARQKLPDRRVVVPLVLQALQPHPLPRLDDVLQIAPSQWQRHISRGQLLGDATVPLHAAGARNQSLLVSLPAQEDHRRLRAGELRRQIRQRLHRLLQIERDTERHHRVDQRCQRLRARLRRRSLRLLQRGRHRARQRLEHLHLLGTIRVWPGTAGDERAVERGSTRERDRQQRLRRRVATPPQQRVLPVLSVLPRS